MRSLVMKSLLGFCMLARLAGCGGGGGGGSTIGTNSGLGTMTVTISSNATTTTTTYNGNNSDPILTAATTTYTEIILESGYNSYTYSWEKNLVLLVNGNTPGVYSLATPSQPSLYSTRISYTDGTRAFSGIYFDSTSGTITINSISGAGQPITGSFNAVLVDSSAPTNTIGMSGSFSVPRQ